jgi:hypothetical protein
MTSVPSQSDTVELSARTAAHLARIRARPGVVDAGELSLDHVRCNVLMRKGLVENAGPGKWKATARGRRVRVLVRDFYHHEINFSGMLDNAWSDDERLLIRAANDLFNGDQAVGLDELVSLLDDGNLRIVLDAVAIRRGYKGL